MVDVRLLDTKHSWAYYISKGIIILRSNFLMDKIMYKRKIFPAFVKVTGQYLCEQMS